VAVTALGHRRSAEAAAAEQNINENTLSKMEPRSEAEGATWDPRVSRGYTFYNDKTLMMPAWLEPLGPVKNGTAAILSHYYLGATVLCQVEVTEVQASL